MDVRSVMTDERGCEISYDRLVGRGADRVCRRPVRAECARRGDEISDFVVWSARCVVLRKIQTCDSADSKVYTCSLVLVGTLVVPAVTLALMMDEILCETCTHTSGRRAVSV